jgi:hypothetical protein
MFHWHSIAPHSSLITWDLLTEEKMCSLGTDIATYPSAHQQMEQPFSTRLVDEDLGDVNFPMTDYTDNLSDYEDDGFYNPDLDNMDFPGYTTTFTKERKFEIILLCTEMETPLYAFEEIMKCGQERHTKMVMSFFHIRRPTIPKSIIWQNGWVWKPIDRKK